MIVYINENTTAKDRKSDRVDWFERKENTFKKEWQKEEMKRKYDCKDEQSSSISRPKSREWQMKKV